MSAAVSARTAVDRRARKAGGVFYTPAELARAVVCEVLEAWSVAGATPAAESPRVLDPACGDGAFLLETFHLLADRCLPKPAADWKPLADLARRCVYGVDVDPEAVTAARFRLAEAIVDRANANPPGSRAALVGHLAGGLQTNLVAGDALLRDSSARQVTAEDTPAGHPLLEQRFDAIVGNPPYVGIRQLSKSYSPRYKAYLSSTYDCAYRAYDLYVLFIERAYELLQPNGVCGFIIPNKIATLDYALPCRRLLLDKTTLHSVTDLSDERVFRDAGVYPYVLIWRKSRPPQDHRIEVKESMDLVEQTPGAEQVAAAGPPTRRQVVQDRLRAETGLTLTAQLDLEQRIETRPLGETARIQCGTTGFAARQMAEHLVEANATADDRAMPFIVSGCIRRYSIQDGNVRFMRRRFERPVLPFDAPLLTENKRALFQSDKIVVSGMSKVLQASWDDRGRALGVQVYCLDRFQQDPFYLLGLLNSRLLSHLFRLRFQAKRLGGGYLAINKGQLTQLPVATARDRASRRAVRGIADTARELSDRAAAGSLTPRLLRQRGDRIDRLVAELYRLSSREMEAMASAAQRG